MGMLKSPAVRVEVAPDRPYHDIAVQIIRARERQGLSQEALAERTGIQRSNISRLESGNYNPSVELLVRVAKGLDMDLQISFSPQV